jgi:tetratricopeptide (TPR) repeat protein
VPGVPFEVLSRQAEEAWAAGRSDDALLLFRAGLDLNPLWREGWWRLGLIHTSAERFAEAREALLHLVSLEPDAGAAWALLGLCEYRLQAYDRALAYLWKGTSLGTGDDEALRRESLLHFALLLMRSGDFGTASKHLARVVSRDPDDPRLMMPCGLLALRVPRLPMEVPDADRDLVATAGRAGCQALALRAEEARRRFDELVARYPKARGVHLAYGLFLRHEASPDALATLQKKAQLFPDDPAAHLEIAFEILERGRSADALVPARAAARLAPDLFSSHLALGRALVATGTLDEGIAELEEAARLAPEDQDVQLALAQAYASAGRPADVERARTKLRELDAKRGARPD